MKIEGDKIMHLFASFVIAMLVAVIFAHTSASVTICIVSGFLVSIGTGIGKEYGDGTFDKGDMLFNLIGALAGCLFGFVKLLI